jgi:AraC-like DNA-binding protein
MPNDAMTGGANNVTLHASEPPPAAPMGRVSDLAAFVAAFRPLGYDPAALVEAVGLAARDLEDPDGRVPCEIYGAIVERAQRERFTPNLALRLATHVPIGAFALLDYLVLTCDDVGGAIRQLGRYCRLVNNPVTFAIDDTVDPVRVGMSGGAAFGTEYTASLLALHIDRETGHRFRGARIHFAHQPDDAGEFERVLRCEVVAGDRWAGVTVPRDTWRVPLLRRDPTLRSVLERQADDMVARLPEPASVSARVRGLFASEVCGEADTRIGAVAKRLAMSGRTLQRRLAVEGVAFQDLLDEWRRDSARRHLANPAMGVADVAYLLGYSEPAAFHRAFRRWYGTTPLAFRRSPGPRTDASPPRSTPP